METEEPDISQALDFAMLDAIIGLALTKTQTYTTGSETVVTLTLTATFVRSVNVTQTLVSTTTKTCSFPAWNWIFGAKSCP